MPRKKKEPPPPAGTWKTKDGVIQYTVLEPASDDDVRTLIIEELDDNLGSVGTCVIGYTKEDIDEQIVILQAARTLLCTAAELPAEEEEEEEEEEEPE